MKCFPSLHPGLFWICGLLLVASNMRATLPANIPAPGSISALLLIEPRDSTSLDGQILASQRRLKATALPGPELERLGWLFIAKARATSDPGFFTLAGIAADALEHKFELPQEAWLLRGHVLQTRHRFAEAEKLARRLVAARGAASDFALLGDALYDEGRIVEAARAYQHMVDLKPSLDSYARAANIRWIKGDLDGAVQLQTLAVRSGGPGDAGALAWSLCRLGQLVWQQGNAVEASTCAARALELISDFAPALLLQGRLLLAAGHATDALAPLGRAVAILPLPEPRWVYAEALHAVGREAEAAEMEERLVREGCAEDPRTVALFLATRGRDSATALRLAQAELGVRADIMTHAANAMALSRVGRMDDAMLQTRAALAEDTVDPRLLLYAGHVTARAGQREAADLLARAKQLSRLLLPSERRLLEDSLSLLPAGAGPKDNISQPTQ
jgi:tetratricopeptide (TPR) repeat protein